MTQIPYRSLLFFQLKPEVALKIVGTAHRQHDIIPDIEGNDLMSVNQVKAQALGLKKQEARGFVWVRHGEM